MANEFHKNLVGTDIHVPITWVYANQTARESATGFSSADLYKFARQSDDNSIWMLTAITPTWVNISGSKDTISFSSGRSRTNTTDIYLRSDDGTPSNLSPFILPFNCTLIAITAATNGNETWTAEIHKNNSLIATATLPITGADFGSISKNIDLNKDDKISMYCNGTNINRPKIIIILRRR